MDIGLSGKDVVSRRADIIGAIFGFIVPFGSGLVVPA